MSLNRAMVIGNLGGDPELRHLPSGQPAVGFSIATDESFTDKQGEKQERVEWHHVVAFGKLAETCNQYLNKGRQVYVEGRLRTREFEGKSNGGKRQRTEIVASRVQFLGPPPAAKSDASATEEPAAHWNPTRMVQRAGRKSRVRTLCSISGCLLTSGPFIGSWIYNMFPDEGLERLLGLVESLSDKIAAIDATGFLDASILGESVHPRNFNTLRRIRDEDGSVIEEEEQFTELASNEFLLKQLRELLDGGGREALDALPDGIHSGLMRPSAKGVFFYFQARPRNGARLHFWKYYDLKSRGIVDNRYLIANLIACDRDTPRVVDPDLFASVFDLQEKVIASILSSVEEQKAREAAPRSMDPIQQTVATAIQSLLSHPNVDRARAVEAIKFISLPMRKTQVTQLRESFKEFQRDSDLQKLLAKIGEIRAKFGEPAAIQPPDRESPASVSRDDLRLICFDIISN